MAVVNPVQYGIAPTPIDLGQFARGMAIGGGITDAVDVMKQREMAQQQAQQNMAIQAAQRAALLDLEKAPSSEKARSILLRFPGLKDQVGGFMSSLNEDEKKARLSQMTEATGFLTSGDVEGAKQAFLRSAQAYENAGRPQDAAPLRRLAEQVEANPDAVRAQLQLRIEAVDPEAGKRLSEFELNKEKVRKEAGEASIKETQAMAEYDRLAAEIGLTNAQAKQARTAAYVAAASLGLEREKFALEKLKAETEAKERVRDLPEPAQKRVIEATGEAVKADMLAEEADRIAVQFEAMAAQGVQGGVLAKGAEWLKEKFGKEDWKTQARKAHDAVRATEVMIKLPPGAASDKDVALAEKPIPEGTNDPALVASWERGVAKRARFSSSMRRSEADFIAQNGGVGMVKRRMVVNGVPLEAGMTYGEVQEVLTNRAIAAAGIKASPIAQPAPTGSRRTGSGRVAQ